MLLLDHFTVLVSGKTHTLKVQKRILTLNVFADQAENPERVTVTTLKVVLVDVVDSVFEAISGDFVTDGFGDESFADLTVFEHVWGFDVEPFFLGHGVDDLLFATFFGLGVEAFVLAYGHGWF